MRINAVSVISTDVAKTIEFFTIIGFKFPEVIAGEDHIEAIVAAGETRLMIDTKELFHTISGELPRLANYSTFAVEYPSSSAVDEVVSKVKAAGFTVLKEPWDAFWGQRYAIIADQDGFMVDVYAPLN